MEANRQLTDALNIITDMQVEANRGNVGRGGGGRGRGGGLEGRMGRGGRGGRGAVRTARLYDNQNYCHAHGYNIHTNHTSVTCNSKGPNHRNDAIFANNQGGPRNIVTLLLVIKYKLM